MSDKLSRREHSFGARRARTYKPGPVTLAPLELRRLFAVGLDPGGWTQVTPAEDTRVIYVSSSSGNDASDGSSPSRPVRTLQRAQALVRDGSADWMLLKRGDSFEAFGDWRKRGRSAQEPILIGAYGQGERPRILSGTRPGFLTLRRDGRSIDNLVIASLDFRAHTYDHFNGDGATAGLRLTSPGRNITIEDVRVAGYKDNIVLDPVGGTLSNVLIRRSQVLDAHAARTVGNGHSQGIYVGPGVNGVRIEENLIDHNGWRHGVESDRTWYNHNIYLQTGARNVEIRGNIISRAGFYGVKANAGGLIRGNFFIRNSEAVYLESDATVEDNVITESVDHPLQHWGVGINTQKASSAVIRGNLIAHSLSGGNGPKAAISLFHNGATFRGVVEKNVVYNWRIGLWNHSPGEGAGSVIIRENQFQVNDQGTAVYHRTNAPVDRFLYAHNTYAAGERTRVNNIAGTLRLPAEWKQQLGESSAKFARVSYPDATRNLARYQESIGASGDFGAFIAAARAVHRGNFNRSYSAGAINSFFRSGFGMEAAGNFTPVGGGAVGSAPAGSVQPSSQPGTPTSPSAPGGAQLPPAPGIQSFTIDRSSAPHSIYVRFNVNVRPSLSKNDLRVVHLPTGRLVPVRSMTWSAEHNRARFNIRVADLPDGKYRATIHAGSVANTQGVELSGSRSIKFHMLAGDTDGDGRLTFRDGSILVNRFNRSGTFASGDLNLDGQVNLEDFVVLAGRASL